MSKRMLSAIAGLSFLLSGPMLPALAEPAEELAPRQVRPESARKIESRLWEIRSVPAASVPRTAYAALRAFAISADGKLLASEDAGRWQLELWDTTTGKSLSRFGEIKSPLALSFSPDGKTLATAQRGFQVPPVVELWDVRARKQIRVLVDDVYCHGIVDIAFSPDGQTLALACPFALPPWHQSPINPGIALLDVARGDIVRWIVGPVVASGGYAPSLAYIKHFDCLGYSPDGQTMALVSDNNVVLWDIANDQERSRLGRLSPKYSRGDSIIDPVVAFSPDGRTLAVGCRDRLIRLWDVVEGQEWLPLVGHESAVQEVWFSADGQTLQSLDLDNIVRTWRVAQARREWPREDQITPKRLAALWNVLHGADRTALYEAIRTLAAAPEAALPFLRERLKSVPLENADRVKQLVVDLKTGGIDKRNWAEEELRKLGEPGESALQKAAAEKQFRALLELERPSFVRPNYADRELQRLREQQEQLLLQRELPKRGPLGDELLQALHALEALERIGTADAKQVLGEVAKRTPQSLLTQEAHATLGRLQAKAAAEN